MSQEHTEAICASECGSFYFVEIRANQRSIGGHFDKGNVCHDATTFIAKCVAHQDNVTNQMTSAAFLANLLLFSFSKAPSDVADDDKSQVY